MVCPFCKTNHGRKAPCPKPEKPTEAPQRQVIPVKPAKTPEVLYHGTTRWNWEFGIKQKGLRANMSKIPGWISCTASHEEALAYSLVKLANDMEKPQVVNMISKRPDIFQDMDHGIVIEIKTAGLEVWNDASDIDPAWFVIKGDVGLEHFGQQYTVPRKGANEKRFKGFLLMRAMQAFQK